MNFLQALKNQVIVFDGAMGTMIQNLHLTQEDFGGGPFKMLSDLLTFSKPQAIKDIHIAYLKAGANAIETNTFGASPLRLKEYNFRDLDTTHFDPLPDNLQLQTLSYEQMAYQMSKISSQIARLAIAEYRTLPEYDGRPLFVAGSIGPSNTVLSSTNASLSKGTWELVENNFYCQVCGLLDGGADVLLFETQQDILELKAAIAGAYRARRERGLKTPIMAQVTVDAFSKMQIFNTDIHAALTTIQHIGVDVFGINCSIGPDLMQPTVEKMSHYSKLPISVIPNAGLPTSENGKTVYKLGAQELANCLADYVKDYGVNIVGGCCGTTPSHIAAITEKVRGLTPKMRNIDPGLYISGPQNAVRVDSSVSLIRIGERLNVRGSQKVREAVENAEGKINYDVLEEVVNEQARDLGVDILDVCMDSNLVNTLDVLPSSIQALTVDFPGAFCLDSFDVEALSKAIQVYPGRPIVNSISMEEYQTGVTKVDALVPLTQFHNPLYIALATGPKGPGLTADEKVELAQQIIAACAKYGVTPGQLLVDVNAFPIGAESVEGMNFSMESLNAIPRVKALHPDLKTTIGVGNLTNGLAKKPYMRVVLTSVFLDEGRKRGLDAAIVNPNHYVPVESLDAHDYELGKRVILERDMNAFAELEEIANNKVGKKTIKRSNYDDLSPAQAICEKVKDGYKERSEGMLKIDHEEYIYQDKIVLQAEQVVLQIAPLDFINQHLMAAMKDLGDGFGRGDVSLPHLLKSADVMKQVMGFLESYMRIKAGINVHDKIQYKGTIVLGTVYQDVHSIGKDLAKTLFENYGYRVIDLGVQVPLEKFIQTALEHKADAIGMSALLVQTSNHMITVARMVEELHLPIPLLIGGAPVNPRHAGYVAMHGQEDEGQIKSDVFYCATAMEGVNTMKNLQSQEKAQEIQKNRLDLLTQYRRAKKQEERTNLLLNTRPRRVVSFDEYRTPVLPHEVRLLEVPLPQLPIDTRNLLMLNWRLGRKESWEKKGFTETSLNALRDEWIEKAHRLGWLRPQGKIAFFPCQAQGDSLKLYNPLKLTEVLGEIDFSVVVSRSQEDIFSAAQFYWTVDSGKYDVVGLQISTCGKNTDEAIDSLKAKGDGESAMMLQGLSDRAAEDLAEWLHQRAREQAGVSPQMGTRYSPGYPGLTNIAINRLIYNLLNAGELGVTLTEADEFSPTGTTAAVVCFHPQARYG